MKLLGPGYLKKDLKALKVSQKKNVENGFPNILNKIGGDNL